MRLHLSVTSVCLVVASVVTGEARREYSRSRDLRERLSKTNGVNGGKEYFDAESGQFKKHPTIQREHGEVGMRIRVANDDGKRSQYVSKRFKRRKKYKRVPSSESEDSNNLAENDNNEGDMDEQLDEDTEERNENFPQLSPLKNKYTTSDKIRMSFQKVDEKNEIPKKREKISDIYLPTSKPIQTIKQIRTTLPNRVEVGEVEGREVTDYSSFENPENIMLTSRNDQELSVQEPNYDFTVGDTSNSPSSMVKPIQHDQLYPTGSPTYPSPTYSPMSRTTLPTLTTPQPLNYSAYPGIYFPPSTNDKVDPHNLENKYDFTIGDTKTLQANPVIQFVEGRNVRNPEGSIPAYISTVTTPRSYHRKVTNPTKLRKSHTTLKSRVSGNKFPHFPSIQMDDSFKMDHIPPRNDFITTPKTKVHQYYKTSHSTNTRLPEIATTQPKLQKYVQYDDRSRNNADKTFKHKSRKKKKHIVVNTPSNTKQRIINSMQPFVSWGKKTNRNIGRMKNKKNYSTTISPMAARNKSPNSEEFSTSELRRYKHSYLDQYQPPTSMAPKHTTHSTKPPERTHRHTTESYLTAYPTHRSHGPTQPPSSFVTSMDPYSYMIPHTQTTVPSRRPNKGHINHVLGTSEQNRRSQESTERVRYQISSDLDNVKPYQPAITFLSSDLKHNFKNFQNFPNINLPTSTTNKLEHSNFQSKVGNENAFEEIQLNNNFKNHQNLNAISQTKSHQTSSSQNHYNGQSTPTLDSYNKVSNHNPGHTSNLRSTNQGYSKVLPSVSQKFSSPQSSVSVGYSDNTASLSDGYSSHQPSSILGYSSHHQSRPSQTSSEQISFPNFFDDSDSFFQGNNFNGFVGDSFPGFSPDCVRVECSQPRDLSLTTGPNIRNTAPWQGERQQDGFLPRGGPRRTRARRKDWKGKRRLRQGSGAGSSSSTVFNRTYAPTSIRNRKEGGAPPSFSHSWNSQHSNINGFGENVPFYY